MDNHLTLNESVFSEINSEESAYWLGFLYADGYIHKGEYNYRIELGLCEEDYSHLEKFKRFIGKDNKISYRDSTHSYRYQFRNKQIHSDLIRLGCTAAKSLTLTFPLESQVSSQFIRHFLRGYFDGDGSFWGSDGKLGASILGTTDFLNGVKNIYPPLSNNSICPIHKERPDKGQRIVFGGRNKVSNFLNYLYKDSTIYLDRKYVKYTQLIATVR